MRLLTALLASTLPLLPDGRVQLLPAEPFAGRTGRPGPGKKWHVPAGRGPAIAAEMNRVAALTPIVIDYEHQTLHAPANGQPAPAAGWIRGGVEWLDGKGLVSKVDWTARAKKSIDDEEYAFISPVIKFDEDTYEVRGVALAALTNYPDILGMDAAMAALNAVPSPHTPSEIDMALLAALLTALALPPTTSETDALAAVGTLRTTADAARSHIAALTGELGLQANADGAAALTAVKALKTGASGSSADMVALVADLTGKVAALTASQQRNTEAALVAQVTAAVDKAIDVDHKLTAGQRDQYIELGKKDFAMLTAILDKAPAVPGLQGQTTGDPGGGGTGTAALTATQRSIAKQLGLDPEAYAKTLQAQA